MELREKYIKSGLLDPKMLATDAKALIYQVPGGMLSNLLKQLKDAGKALDVTASKLDLLTKLVDNVPKMTLKRAYTTNKRFNTAVNSSNEFKRLYEIALKLEGLPRHTSIHAAGIVMSDRPLNVNMPLLKVDDSYCTQYTMEYLEEMGLIKMDFLGLKNLSIIAEINENVNRIQPLDILKIPLDDRKTYELISRADTAGVFQLDSDGMKNLLRKLKPTLKFVN